MFILPFFLAMVFGLLMLVMLVFKGEMLTYATYMAARVASVKHPVFGNAQGDAERAARQIMPGVDISINYFPIPGLDIPIGSNPLMFNVGSQSGTIAVTGSYRLNPLVAARTNSSLDSGMPNSSRTITARVPMHHFQSPQMGMTMTCDRVKDDNCYTQF